MTNRAVALDIVHNSRHLGGIPKASGETRATDIVRSGSLDRLTDQGIDALRQQGITTIIDFRSTNEFEAHPTPDLARHDMRVVHAPVYRTDASPVGLGQGEFPGFAFVYERFLDIGAPAYRTLAETIAEQPDGVLFHCAVGKDRTGVAAALLLNLAGVDDATILEDYCHSEAELHPLIPEFREQWNDGRTDEARLQALMAAPRDAMETTLQLVHQRWGSAEGYFAAIGVTEDTISALRSRIAG